MGKFRCRKVFASVCHTCTLLCVLKSVSGMVNEPTGLVKQGFSIPVGLITIHNYSFNRWLSGWVVRKRDVVATVSFSCRFAGNTSLGLVFPVEQQSAIVPSKEYHKTCSLWYKIGFYTKRSGRGCERTYFRVLHDYKICVVFTWNVNIRG